MPEPSWLKPIFGSHPIGTISGAPAAIRATARAYETWSGRLNDAGTAIKKVDAEAWQGAAAEAFKAKFEVEPKRWFDASDRVLEAARALDTYAYTLEWAQREVAEARAEWTSGNESSRAGATSNASTGALVLWQQQEYAEKTLGLPPKPAYPGDHGAAVRSRALWRMNNAKNQHDAAGDDAAVVVDAAADDLPVHRNFLDNVGEFFRGIGDNFDAFIDTATNPAGAVSAAGDQTRLWFANQQAAFEQLIDKEGHDKNFWRWSGSMIGGVGIGRVGKLVQPRYLPNGVKRGYYKNYRANGHAPLPGKSGGDGVVQVRGENLNVTPEIRERASRLSAYRMDHIIERHGPDTLYPDPSTNMFPGNWTHDKVFSVVQDVASDPNAVWQRADDLPAEGFHRIDGKAARFEVNGFYQFDVNGVEQSLPVQVIVEPYGEGIITGYRPNF